MATDLLVYNSNGETRIAPLLVYSNSYCYITITAGPESVRYWYIPTTEGAGRDRYCYRNPSEFLDDGGPHQFQWEISMSHLGSPVDTGAVV